MADTHKYVGIHPYDLNGRPLAPGDTFTPKQDELDSLEMKEFLDNGTVLNLSKAGGGDNK